jgi:hypothetical protein
VGSSIQAIQVTSLHLRPRTLAEIVPEHSLDERRTGLLRASELINTRQNISRECDGSLLFHTTIILPILYYRREIELGQPVAPHVIRENKKAAILIAACLNQDIVLF